MMTWKKFKKKQIFYKSNERMNGWSSNEIKLMILLPNIPHGLEYI